MTLAGQDEDIQYSLQIDSVNITSLAHSKSLKGQLTNGKSFINALDQSNHFTVRSGGPGLLSTILRRGAASRHIAIIWEDFNIQSVVNGTYDVNLIPRSLDKNYLLSHNVNPLLGNASTAGAVAVGQKLSSKPKSQININFGSDENLGLTSLIKLKSGGYYQHIGIDLNNNRNRYNFKLNGQTRAQKNAQLQNVDFNYKGRYILSKNITVNGGFWLQKSDRDIPPTKTSVTLDQSQADENYRFFMNSVISLNEKSYLKLNSAYFKEKIHFLSPGIDSKSNADSYNTSASYNHNNGLNLNLSYRLDHVKASFFTESKSRTTLSAIVGYQKLWNDIKVVSTFRPQLIDGVLKPLTMMVNLSKERKRSTIGLIYNRGFTLPSFNDLYWPAGGNPDLLEETSDNFELNYSISDKSTLDIEFSTALFYNLIDNWIQWIPVEGVFQPVNQRKVRNAGVELDFSLAKKLGALSKLKLELHYAFVDSRLAEHYTIPALEGKRTIFVPAHKLASTCIIAHKDWQFVFRPVWYSKRFESVDNTVFVPGYLVTDLEIVKSIKIKKNSILASLAIENVANADYEHIRFYPMPLRIFKVGIQFNFN